MSLNTPNNAKNQLKIVFSSIFHNMLFMALNESCVAFLCHLINLSLKYLPSTNANYKKLCNIDICFSSIYLRRTANEFAGLSYAP